MNVKTTNFACLIYVSRACFVPALYPVLETIVVVFSGESEVVSTKALAVIKIVWYVQTPLFLNLVFMLEKKYKQTCYLY